MNYILVKQYYNDAVDNGFKCFYKIADFGKLLAEAFWAFCEIWVSLSLILYNAIMYVYYIVIYIVERITNIKLPIKFWQMGSGGLKPIPGRVFVESNVVPNVGAASVTRRVASNAANAVTGALSDVQSSSMISVADRLGRTPSGVKVSFAGKVADSIRRFNHSIIDFLTALVGKITGKNSRKAFHVKDRGTEEDKSLIDEYMKEYEQRKK